MVKVGNIEIKGELVMRNLDSFLEDVPVNDRHVTYLMGLLQSQGQIEPLLTWAGHNRIINGFHRNRAMKNLGWKEGLCLEYSCNEHEFWNLRISSAVTHKSVSVARIVEWVRKAFSITEWGQKMSPEQAFTWGRRGSATKINLTPDERFRLSKWTVDMSGQWGLSVQEIGEMLKLAQLVGPELVKEVRDQGEPGTLTRTILEAISRLDRTDLQKTLVAKVRAEKLSLKAVTDLVSKLRASKTEVERERLLRTQYQSPKKGRSTKNAQHDLKKLRTELVTESLRQINMVLPQLQGPQPFDDLVSETLATLTIYQGGPNKTALELLQRENQNMKTQVRDLSDSVDRKDEQMKGMRRTMGSLQQEIDTLRRRD